MFFNYLNKSWKNSFIVFPAFDFLIFQFLNFLILYIVNKVFLVK